jgi:dTMP kinase
MDIDRPESRARGTFITLEGVEGSGKTTQLAALEDRLRKKGFAVHRTREPGGTTLGDAIRAIILRPDHSQMAPMTELLLIEACRAQHVHEVLRPSLERGDVILCDRYTDATLAYQGHGRGLDFELVRSMNHTAAGGLIPDLTILLDCPVELGLDRSWLRLRAEDKAGMESRFENEAMGFHTRVREGYLSIARKEPQRVKVVDASNLPEVVEKAIWDRVSDYLSVR